MFARLETLAGEHCEWHDERTEKRWGKVVYRWFVDFPLAVLGGAWEAAYGAAMERVGKEEYKTIVRRFIYREQSTAEAKLAKRLWGSERQMVVETKTAFQRVAIHNETADLGSPYSLSLDGYVQSNGLDESVYHGVMVHTALLAHPHPERVFLGGSGEGFALRDVLMHSSVSEATMVEIDGELVDMSKRWLGAYHKGSFDDPRARVLIGDARGYLESNETDRAFDVILLDFNEFYHDVEGEDLTQCLNLGGLFSVEFFAAVKRRLRPGGVMLAQTPSYEECSVRNSLAQVFGQIHYAAMPMIAYPFNLFAVASDSVDAPALTAEDIDGRAAERLSGPTWYTGAAYDRLWDLERLLLAESRLPCRSDCVIRDQPDGATECTRNAGS